MMAVAPTVELAKRNSKQRIDPLIEESEVLRERVKERRSRDSVCARAPDRDFRGAGRESLAQSKLISPGCATATTRC
jgi:phage terminase large subunit GpA-like protein